MVTDRAELHQSGDELGKLETVGSLTCVECDYALSLEAVEELPRCPACGGTAFRRARLFDRPTMDADTVEPADSDPPWLAEVRGRLERPGPHLAFERHGEPVVVALEQGWTRIGRSGAADVRLDDPTVSRRHALVVWNQDMGLRALDDRSLNGLFVNGERVESATLSDGDELEIGRFRVYVLDD